MTRSRPLPRVILLMGVAGCGKTTLGRLLAVRLGYTFLDADDYHSAAAVARMRAGQPLTDALRDCWVERLQQALASELAHGPGTVLAFSGLRARHRRLLAATGFDTRAFLLGGSTPLLQTRLAGRQGHFMPASQLPDQLAALEPIAADEHIEPVNIAATPDEIVAHLLARIATARDAAQPGPGAGSRR